jgi:hypothetical protein
MILTYYILQYPGESVKIAKAPPWPKIVAEFHPTIRTIKPVTDTIRSPTTSFGPRFDYVSGSQWTKPRPLERT